MIWLAASPSDTVNEYVADGVASALNVVVTALPQLLLVAVTWVVLQMGWRLLRWWT